MKKMSELGLKSLWIAFGEVNKLLRYARNDVIARSEATKQSRFLEYNNTENIIYEN